MLNTLHYSRIQCVEEKALDTVENMLVIFEGRLRV
jgi:hypothetical protein